MGNGAESEKFRAGEPPSQEASNDGGGEAAGGGASAVRIAAGRNREAVIVRYPKRKLFNKECKKTFLEWFAATANLGWAAEKAGVTRQTVSKHLYSDPEFAAAYEDTLRVARLRLKAKMLETRKPEGELAPDFEADAPDIDMPVEKGLAVLRELDREAALGRRQGTTPRVASNAEVMLALKKAVRAMRRMVERRGGQGARPPASPSKLGEDQSE